MDKSNQKKSVSLNASEFFQQGLHCAESVVASVLEALDIDPNPAISHATAFGGGFGRSFDDTCGAISGAMIVIGHLHGRSEGTDSWELPAQLGSRIRNYFIRQQGTTHCGTLREGFGEEQQFEECQRLTSDIAAELFEILTEEQKLRTA